MKKLFYLFSSLLLLSFASCENETIQEDPSLNENQEESFAHEHFKQPPPGTVFKEAYWRGEKITYYEMDGLKITGGDVVLYDSELSDTPQIMKEEQV
ncbi:MAG: hypothetical protein HC854_11100 [Flavobacterium sp.]|nr:hypothetical protein [Flavobacterium sp.]